MEARFLHSSIAILKKKLNFYLNTSRKCIYKALVNFCYQSSMFLRIKKKKTNKINYKKFLMILKTIILKNKYCM